MQRGMIDDACNRLAASGATLEKAVQSHSRWVEVQTTMLVEGPPLEAKWNMVQHQIDFWQDQINKWTAVRDDARINVHRVQFAALKVLAGLQPALNVVATDASIALRAELDLHDDDLDELRRTLRQNGEVGQDTLQAAIQRLDQVLSQFQHGPAH